MYSFYITPEEYQIAESNGISRNTLDIRVRDLLWDKERAITEPTQKKNNGEMKWADVAESNNIPRQTYYTRRKRGMSKEEAATKPLQNKKKWASIMRERKKIKGNMKYPSYVYEKARKNGISHSMLDNRMNSGNFTFEEAYTLPPLSPQECARLAHKSRRSKSGVQRIS